MPESSLDDIDVDTIDRFIRRFVAEGANIDPGAAQTTLDEIGTDRQGA